MRRALAFAPLALAAAAIAQAPGDAPVGPPVPPPVERVHGVLGNHLGRPYVWGASGLKSFDCSGFLWRVLWDSGVMIKRTTARKFFMSLPPVPEGDTWTFPTVVFFDDLEHVGIVHDRETFFHAALTLGTHESRFDPYWRPKIYGFRAAPLPR